VQAVVQRARSSTEQSGCGDSALSLGAREDASAHMVSVHPQFVAPSPLSVPFFVRSLRRCTVSMHFGRSHERNEPRRAPGTTAPDAGPAPLHSREPLNLMAAQLNNEKTRKEYFWY